MNMTDAQFKNKFMSIVNNKKAEAGKTSSLMKLEKRDRVIRCLQNPELEPNVKFRARVRERKFRLLQENGEVFLGVPDETSGELVYRRAACVEEFWDIIHAAHVDNGHIGLVHTFNAIRGVYALLPRYLVSVYVKMCPVCSHAFRKPQHKKAAMINSAAIATSNPPSTATAPVAFVVDPGAAAGGEVKEGIVGSEGGEVVVAVASQEEAETDSHMDTSDDHVADPSDLSETTSDALSAGASSTAEAQSPSIQVVFTCHICEVSFTKKLFYQRHIRAHREHAPRIPFVSPYKALPTVEKKRVKVERRSFTTVSRGRQVIVDGDMGVEACQALMMAAWRSDLSLVGVTCVSGSVTIDRACSNALQVLSVCERDDLQVFCGAERPLVRKNSSCCDSLPGPSWQNVVDNSQIKSEHAVSAMIRMITENPGKISLVCLGPLTNLALAIRLDPNLPKKLKEVIIIGGNIEGRGDSSLCAEHNFHYDPEAAFVVLEEMPNIILLPYEVCDRHKLTGDFFDSWIHLGTSRSEFVRGMGDESWVSDNQRSGYTPHCAYAMALVADRSIALERKFVYATVELGGVLSRGMMVVDWASRLQHQPNVELVKSLDLGKIQSLLTGMVEDPEALEVYTV